MIYIDLIKNLSLLVAISVVSVFIGQKQLHRFERLIQGLTFGTVTVIGMLSPLVLGPGLIFDGRSVMISLCGLFFGPLAVSIAASMSILCRILQGGPGVYMGVLVALCASVIGMIFHRRRRHLSEPSIRFLWGFGLLVHIAMLLMMLALPPELIPGTFQRMALPILLFYPLATVLAGKILSDHQSRVRFLHALSQSKEELRTTLYSIGDAVISTDTKGRVRQMNPAAEQLTGWLKTEAEGRPLFAIFRIINEDTRNPVENPVSRTLESGMITGLANHTLLIAKDGTERPIADSAAPIFSSDGSITGVVLVFRDQTSERAAEKSSRDLRRIEWMVSKKPAETKNTPFEPDYGNLATLNQDGLILKSVGYETLKQIARDYMALLGTSSAIYEMNGDYAFGIFDSGWCRMMDRASRTLCRTGDNAEALASGQWLCHESCWGSSRQTIATGKPVDIECSGGLHLYAIPVRANNKIIGAINFGYGDPPRDPEKLRKLAETHRLDYEDLRRAAEAYDSRPAFIIEMAKERLETSARLIGLLVELKLAAQEHKNLEEQLSQSQKMEAIGQLAGGIAHDFNNMLQVILGRTDILMSQIPPDSIHAESLVEIFKSAQRSADLTRQLLAFARKQTIAPEVLDLNLNVASTLNLLRRLIGENIDLRWIPAEKPIQVKMDPAQLNQILTNLTVNARDAIQTTGRIRIETGIAVFDDGYCKTHSGFLPGAYAMLAVSDDGCGMDKETCAHIFEPFFTTKPTGKGVGLGLATLYGIVRQNNGFINLYSEPGQGSVFKVYIPLYSENSLSIEPQTPVRPPQQGRRTILFVEDEETLLSLGRMQLEDLGYTVLSSHLPKEALRLAGEYSGEIHLLITDVVMPELSGLELSKEIIGQRPGTKLLFMSGYTADIISNHGVLDQGLQFLQKPFSNPTSAG